MGDAALCHCGRAAIQSVRDSPDEVKHGLCHEHLNQWARDVTGRLYSDDTETMIARIRPRLGAARNRALQLLYIECPNGPRGEGEAEEMMLAFLAGAVACLQFMPGGESGNAKLLNIAQSMTVLWGEFPHEPIEVKG